jgi:hypothetical protein
MSPMYHLHKLSVVLLLIVPHCSVQDLRSAAAEKSIEMIIDFVGISYHIMNRIIFVMDD